MMKIWITILLGLCSAGVSLAQKSSEDRYELLQRYLAQEEERLGFTGVCLIAKGGRIEGRGRTFSFEKAD